MISQRKADKGGTYTVLDHPIKGLALWIKILELHSVRNNKAMSNFDQNYYFKFYWNSLVTLFDFLSF